MIKNILFAGKDFPHGEQYFSTALDAGLTALITRSADDEELSENPHILQWNKGSVVSSHSLVIQAENLASSIDAACLIFDCPHFTSLYNDAGTASLQSAACDLILSFQLLAKALMDRFLLKKHGRLVFILRASQTPADAVKKNSDAGYINKDLRPHLCAAQSAFISFAENFSCMHADAAPEKIMLIKAGSETDAEISRFLLSKLAVPEVKSVQKKNSKDATAWISVSGKDEGAFGFFKRF